MLEAQVTSLKTQPFSPSVLFSHLLGQGWHTETPHSGDNLKETPYISKWDDILSCPSNREHIESTCVWGDTSQHTFDRVPVHLNTR